MQKVRFICEHSEAGRVAQSICVETTHDTITEVAEAFRQFLHAMGYHPDNVKELLDGHDS